MRDRVLPKARVAVRTRRGIGDGSAVTGPRPLGALVLGPANRDRHPARWSMLLKIDAGVETVNGHRTGGARRMAVTSEPAMRRASV